MLCKRISCSWGHLFPPPPRGRPGRQAFLGQHTPLAVLLAAGHGGFSSGIFSLQDRAQLLINTLKLQFRRLTKVVHNCKKIIFGTNTTLSSLHSCPEFSKGIHTLLAAQPTICSVQVSWI